MDAEGGAVAGARLRVAGGGGPPRGGGGVGGGVHLGEGVRLAVRSLHLLGRREMRHLVPAEEAAASIQLSNESRPRAVSFSLYQFFPLN